MRLATWQRRDAARSMLHCPLAASLQLRRRPGPHHPASAGTASAAQGPAHPNAEQREHTATQRSRQCESGSTRARSRDETRTLPNASSSPNRGDGGDGEPPPRAPLRLLDRDAERRRLRPVDVDRRLSRSARSARLPRSDAYRAALFRPNIAWGDSRGFTATGANCRNKQRHTRAHPASSARANVAH
jgi:hypothetical protein